MNTPSQPSAFAPLKNDTFIRACLRQATDYTPIWLMRQAGRFLPEYRATRAKAGSFMGLATNVDYATEVTLQPVERFRADTHGSMKTERVICAAQIVINGLWNSNNRNSFAAKLIGNGKCSITTNRDQNIQTPLPEMLNSLVGMILENNFLSLCYGNLERIRTVRCPENGPTQGEDP